MERETVGERKTHHPVTFQKLTAQFVCVIIVLVSTCTVCVWVDEKAQRSPSACVINILALDGGNCDMSGITNA